MGYDIYFVGESAEDATGIDATGYFRRNIWGMGPLRDAMAKAKMGYWPESDLLAAFPSRDDFPDDDDYERASEPVLTQHPGEGWGVPLHKLCSNDGWIITPSECLEACAALEEYRKAHGLDEFKDDMATDEALVEFATFLRAAADHEGARVW
jgi:hypothetical protein